MLSRAFTVLVAREDWGDEDTAATGQRIRRAVAEEFGVDRGKDVAVSFVPPWSEAEGSAP